MPIDPNIALGIQPMQPVDLTKIQQLRLLMGQEELQRQQVLQSMTAQQLGQAQIEEARARLPGIQAVAEQQQQQARLLKDREEAINASTDPITGEINYQIAANKLRARGRTSEAEELERGRLVTFAQNLNNLRTEQDRQVALLKEKENVMFSMANALYSAEPGLARTKILQSKRDSANKVIPGLGDDAAAAFMITDPKTGQKVIDNDLIQGMYKAQIGPLQQENLRLEKTRNMINEQSMDPNSNFSKDVQTAASQLFPGIDFSGQPGAALLLNERVGPTLRQYFAEGIPDRQFRQSAATNIGLLSSDVAKVDNTLSLLKKLEDAGRGLPTTAGTKFGNWVKNNVTQSADKAAFDEAFRIYNRINKDNPITVDNFDASQLRAMLETLKSTLNTDLENQRGQLQQRQLTPPASGQSSTRMPSGRADERATAETRGTELGAIISSGDPQKIRDAIAETQNLMNLAFQKDKNSVVGQIYKDQLTRLNDALNKKQAEPASGQRPAAPSGVTLQPGKVYVDAQGNRAIYEGKDKNGKDKWKVLK